MYALLFCFGFRRALSRSENNSLPNTEKHRTRILYLQNIYIQYIKGKLPLFGIKHVKVALIGLLQGLCDTSHNIMRRTLHQLEEKMKQMMNLGEKQLAVIY